MLFRGKVIVLIIFCFFVIETKSVVLIDASLEEEIDESSLIIKGTLIDKYSKNDYEVFEYAVNKKGEELGSSNGFIYTTFTFKVDEVILGDYVEKTLDVKMQGGCNELGECEGGFLEYDFSKGDNAVLFLKKMYKLDFYQTTVGGDTAFKVLDDGQLLRKSEENEKGSVHKISISEEGKLKVEEPKLTLQYLKHTVERRKNK